MIPWAHWVSLSLLFLSAAFFANTETALFSLSKIEKRRLENAHPKLARWVLDHLNQPRRTLVTILIGNLFVHILASAIATTLALEHWGVRGLSLALSVFTVLLVIFAEIIPKIVAVRKNEFFALAGAIPLRIFSVLILPVRRLTRLITDWILSFLVPEQRDHHDQISEEELKALVKIGEEEGVLDRQERQMIQKIFELGERSVRAIMTPRVDLVGLDISDPREKQLALIQKYHFSHFLVYQNSIDHILGVVSVQDYVLNPEADLSALLIQPLFVPEGKQIDDLLADFRAKGQGFAVCVDEYGGTAGIVTLEDVLEEIFGEFYDEYAKVENPIRAFGKEESIVEAKIALSAFNEHFGTSLEADEASTLGGFILEKMGEVPEKGKALHAGVYEIRIHEVIGQRRIKSVIVRKRS